MRIKKQEFPYDIGIFANMRQGMGGSINVCSHYHSLATRQLTPSIDLQLALATCFQSQSRHWVGVQDKWL